MKVIYYEGLIERDYGLSANERIIYSFVLYQSLSYMWREIIDDEDYKVETEKIEELDNEIDLPSFYFAENGQLKCERTIAKKTGINQSTVSRVFTRLRKMGIADFNREKIRHLGLFKSHYFYLDTASGLKGELLIFYSWLKKIAKGKDVIYASPHRLSEMYCREKEQVIYNYIHRLKDYLERDENGFIKLKQ